MDTACLEASGACLVLYRFEIRSGEDLCEMEGRGCRGEGGIEGGMKLEIKVPGSRASGGSTSS